MIKSIIATNYLNESIEFELFNPEKSGFYIRDIIGIGSPEANINMTEVSTNDGAIFTSARATSRNIVLTLGFLEKNTIEDVRHLSYKYFPVKRPVKITVVSDTRVGEIIGYVEKNDPIIFSERQTTQISILCPDPFFYSQDKTITLFRGVIPIFEFPFSNESLTEKLLVMGDIWPEAMRSVYYDGDAEVGVVISILAKGPVTSDIIIFDVETEQQMIISSERLIDLTGSSIVEGDRIVISTVRGNKYILLIREGITTNILNALNRNAFWFELKKGDNIFAYTTEFGLANLDFQIENRTIYAGV